MGTTHPGASPHCAWASQAGGQRNYPSATWHWVQDCTPRAGHTHSEETWLEGELGSSPAAVSFILTWGVLAVSGWPRGRHTVMVLAAPRRGLGKLCCRTWSCTPAPFLGGGASWGGPPVLCSSKLSPCCVRAHCHADQGPWECVLSPHSPTPCSPCSLLPTAPRPGRCLSTQPLCPVRLAGLESVDQAARIRHEAPGTLRRAWFCQRSSEINPH